MNERNWDHSLPFPSGCRMRLVGVKFLLWKRSFIFTRPSVWKTWRCNYAVFVQTDHAQSSAIRWPSARIPSCYDVKVPYMQFCVTYTYASKYLLQTLWCKGPTIMITSFLKYRKKTNNQNIYCKILFYL